MSVVDTVLRAIRQHDLIARDACVVVAVSGGADSLALLHILRKLRAALECSLHVATLNHRLRGDAGAADARFVEQAARQWKLPVTVGAADVNALARQQGVGVEAAARQARYHFLASVARQVGASVVAVAHHADDQAETILMHLLRGAGVQGLAGMAFRAPLPGDPSLQIIRPLLAVARADIEAYCREQGLQPREDVTNRDTDFLRNQIRWELMPRLKTASPRIVEALSQFGEIASVEQDYMTQQLEQLVQAHVAVSAERVLIDRRAFRELHGALQRRCIRWAIEWLCGSTQDLFYEHVILAVAVGARGEVGALARLPNGLRLRVDYEAVAIERETAAPILGIDLLLDGDVEVAVSVPGTTSIPGRDWELTAAHSPLPGFQARLAVPESSQVVLRTRRPGDVFAPLGLEGHTQKLKKWMIDHKVTGAARDLIPLLVVDGTVAAILYGPQWAVSENFAVSDVSQRVVYLRAERIFKTLL